MTCALQWLKLSYMHASENFEFTCDVKFGNSKVEQSHNYGYAYNLY